MEEAMPERDWHRKYAIDLFNKVWELLEKDDRTPDEDDRMIHAAHASRYHWGEIGTPLEAERGEWQISRVYSVLRKPESAVFHAERCLEICQRNGFKDFDLAFAYEAMARSSAVAGNRERSGKYLELAESEGKLIEDEDDRDYFMKELEEVRELQERLD